MFGHYSQITVYHLSTRTKKKVAGWVLKSSHHDPLHKQVFLVAGEKNFLVEPNKNFSTHNYKLMFFLSSTDRFLRFIIHWLRTPPPQKKQTFFSQSSNLSNSYLIILLPFRFNFPFFFIQYFLLCFSFSVNKKMWKHFCDKSHDIYRNENKNKQLHSVKIWLVTYSF